MAILQDALAEDRDGAAGRRLLVELLHRLGGRCQRFGGRTRGTDVGLVDAHLHRRKQRIHDESGSRLIAVHGGFERPPVILQRLVDIPRRPMGIAEQFEIGGDVVVGDGVVGLQAEQSARALLGAPAGLEGIAGTHVEHREVHQAAVDQLQ